MICKNECGSFREFREDLRTGYPQHWFDAEEAIDVLVVLAEDSEKSGGHPSSPAVLEEIIGFEKGYVDLLFDVCADRGITGLGVLGAVLRAASTQDCGTCPFAGLTLPELSIVESQGLTDGRS